MTLAKACCSSAGVRASTPTSIPLIPVSWCGTSVRESGRYCAAVAAVTAPLFGRSTAAWPGRITSVCCEAGTTLRPRRRRYVVVDDIVVAARAGLGQGSSEQEHATLAASMGREPPLPVGHVLPPLPLLDSQRFEHDRQAVPVDARARSLPCRYAPVPKSPVDRGCVRAPTLRRRHAHSTRATAIGRPPRWGRTDRSRTPQLPGPGRCWYPARDW